MDRSRMPAAIVLVLVALWSGGCGTNPTPVPTQGLPPTPPPGEPTPATGNAVVVESPWGPIWDAVPREFLIFAGAQPVEIPETVSIALDHPAQAASPSDIAGAYVSGLALDDWDTVVNGPIEDGSMTVDAVRDGTTCRAQVTATPLGGVVRITVRYGADCPKP